MTNLLTSSILILYPKITETCGVAKWQINMQLFRKSVQIKVASTKVVDKELKGDNLS